MSEVRLNEYNADEWWDLARQMNPGITREEYEDMWTEFAALKAEHERNKRLN